MSRQTSRRATLTTARLEKLKPHEILWDTSVRGLCARRQTSAAITFGVKYTTPGGRQRWLTIGRWGSPWEPGTARQEALKVLGLVANGIDPQATKEHRSDALTVRCLLHKYLDEVGSKKQLKPRTLAEYRRLADDVIGPRVGATLAQELTHQDVAKLHGVTLAGTPHQANRCVAFMRASFNAFEHLVGGHNPARRIMLHQETARDRVLLAEELGRLGATLRDPAVINREGIYACAAILLLLLTGRRKNEILKLKWSNLSPDRTTMVVDDHKASRRKGAVVYPIGKAAARLLAALPGQVGNPYVFPSPIVVGAPLHDLDETWRRCCKLAKIEGARIHDLRRTHATQAAGVGLELGTTQRLLGHSSANVTSQVYIRQNAGALLPAADIVSESLIQLVEAAPDVEAAGC